MGIYDRDWYREEQKAPNIAENRRISKEDAEKLNRMIAASNVTNQKKRHFFVTFWLGFIIFGSVIGLLLAILRSDYVNLFYNSHIAYIYIGIISLVVLISAVLILNWHIIGLWLMVASSAIVAFLMISWGYGITSVIFQSLVPLVVLWGILQLKKNGVSAWSYLRGKF